jgi:O-antigen/teichoic acid export membrane protein
MLAIGILATLQWFVLGEEYRSALPVFLVTSSAVSVSVFLGLGTMLVHTMMKPHIDAFVNAARLGVMVLLALILVPSMRALGAAIAYAVPVMAGELWMFRYVRRENRGRTVSS